jgi:hypothetical protein
MHVNWQLVDDINGHMVQKQASLYCGEFRLPSVVIRKLPSEHEQANSLNEGGTELVA